MDHSPIPLEPVLFDSGYEVEHEDSGDDAQRSLLGSQPPQPSFTKWDFVKDMLTEVRHSSVRTFAHSP
jgi:hypothetical protein